MGRTDKEEQAVRAVCPTCALGRLARLAVPLRLRLAPLPLLLLGLVFCPRLVLAGLVLARLGPALALALAALVVVARALLRLGRGGGGGRGREALELVERELGTVVDGLDLVVERGGGLLLVGLLGAEGLGLLLLLGEPALGCGGVGHGDGVWADRVAGRARGSEESEWWLWGESERRSLDEEEPATQPHPQLVLGPASRCLLS